MSTETTERPLRENTIPEARLHRIGQAVHHASARSELHPEWYVNHFGYDHGSLIVYTQSAPGKPGKAELIIDAQGDILKGNVTRAIYELNPATTEELIRGYRLARAAGLLGDGRYSLEAMQYASSLGCGFSPPERAADGAKVMAAMAEALRKADRQPGGIKLNDPPAREKKS